MELRFAAVRLFALQGCIKFAFPPPTPAGGESIQRPKKFVKVSTVKWRKKSKVAGGGGEIKEVQTLYITAAPGSNCRLDLD